MLKSSLHLQLGQHLTMTPQLQQAIRLLQLSTLELELEIQQVLESNPMLEQIDDHDDGVETEKNDEPIQDSTTENTDVDDYPEMETILPWEDRLGSSQNNTNDADFDLLSNQAEASGGLQQHLLWQLQMGSLSQRDQRIGIMLIDSISTDGYLETTLESIQLTLNSNEDIPVELDEIEAVLHWIQRCDPVGVGARNLQECLRVQLLYLPEETPARSEALRLVEHNLQDLGRHDFRAIQKNLGLDGEQLGDVLELVKSLNPRPGGQISDQPAEYVVPDVYVRREKGLWKVELNPEIAPRVRINGFYAGLLRQVKDARDNAFMRTQLQEARWFIKSLHSRNETLLRVAQAIVEHQQLFLEEGDVAMQPLILRDIADALGMHESTISRVTTRKYMHTPRGVFEFKYFFSSHVGTRDGGECSATAIRAMIRQLIDEEPPGRPMSDSRLAQVLSDRGINVARRTVAKYREAMRLPPSSERRQIP